MRKNALFYLNGNRCEVRPEHAGMMLAEYLRYERGLTGTKIVCAEGDCGACTVLRFFPKLSPRSTAQTHFVPINSCIIIVAQLDGSSIVTIDALAKTTALTEVQKAMMDCHGSQCGFCTPGFVMALTGLVEKKLCYKKNNDIIHEREAKNAMTGNLCRCTGYQPIIEAATTINLTKCIPIKERFYSPAQERELKKILTNPLFIEGKNFSYFAPRTIKEAAKYLQHNKDARILSAATDLGVVHNKRKIRLQKLVSLHLMPSLYEIKKLNAGRVSVGARVTLSELRQAMQKKVPEFARFLDLFASPQIKNIATLIGNVGNASPIADTPPFLLAMDAVVQVVGAKGKRSIPLDQFYLAYRKTALKVGEVIVAIDFALPQITDSLALYKVSQRKDLDISAVNAAFRISWANKKNSQIQQIRLAMGGVAATPIRLKKTERIFTNALLTNETMTKAIATLQTEINPLHDLRGSIAFRRIIAENFLQRFFREHGGEIKQ